MPDKKTGFGKHIPTSTNKRTSQSPMAVFTRGLQVPGTRWVFKFDNGYGASVIDDGYGADRGLYELAVLNARGAIDYDTPLTNDVLGYLSHDEVVAALDQIEALPAAAEAATR